MQHLKYIILFAVFSLYACKDGPQVSVYISDPARNGMSGIDKNETPIFAAYKDTENFVCFKPSDFETIANYCKLKDEK